MQNSQIEVKETRNGQKVPVVDGVYLHSIYDPKKEAEAFADKNIESIANKNTFLILGLGFAYHIEEMIRLLDQKNKPYSIVVIEPNNHLLKSFESERKISLKNTIVANFNEIESYYNNRSFVEFLGTKPAIIKHDSSYALNEIFYRSFLSYKAQETVAGYEKLINTELRNYFSDSNISKELSIAQYAKEIKVRGRVTHQYDFFLLALDELLRSTKNMQQG